MAPPSPTEIIPLEMIVLVGHKLASTSSTRKEDQSCPVLLPSKSSKSGALKFRSVDFLHGPSPNHGFLRLSNPREMVTFERLLEMFIAAYGETLKTKDYDLSEESVIEIFFNYTNKNGERDASPALVPTAAARFGNIFKSASASAQPIPCRCGCNGGHHGPFIIVVLDGAIWQKRGENNFDASTQSYVLPYKDDLHAKVNTFPLENLVPVIINQEVSSVKAKDKILHYIRVEEHHLEMQKQSDWKIDVLQKQIARIEMGKGETGYIQESHSPMTTPNEKVIEDANDLTARNEKLTKEATALTVRNEELLKANNALEELLHETVRPAAVAYSANKDSEQREKVTRESYNKMEAANKILKAKNLDLEKQLANLKTTTNVPQANRDQQANLHTPETEGALNAGLILNPSYQALLRNLRALVHRDIRATRELDMIKARLRIIQTQFQQRQPYLAMHTTIELIRLVSSFPLPVTTVDLDRAMTIMMNHVTLPAAAPGRSSPLNTAVDRGGARNVSISTTPANASNFVEFNADTQQPSKKRKLDETSAVATGKTTSGVDTLSAPRNIFAAEKTSPAIPPKGPV